MKTTDRLVGFVVVATFAYVIMEAAARSMIEQRERFNEWKNSFVERYNRNPGHREFLRDVLIREEMHVKSNIPVADDCGCPDA